MDLFLIFLLTDFVVCMSLSPRHDTSSRGGWRNGLQTWSVAANILNEQSRTEVKW